MKNAHGKNGWIMITTDLRKRIRVTLNGWDTGRIRVGYGRKSHLERTNNV